MPENETDRKGPKLTTQVPSLGRMVHFYPGGAAGLECWSGVITAVKPNNVVNIHVFSDAENGYPKGGDAQRDVPLAEPGMSGRRWEWPPYIPPAAARVPAPAPTDPPATSDEKTAEPAAAAMV